MFNSNTNGAFQKNTPPSHQNSSIQNENLFRNSSAVRALVEQSGFWGPYFSQTKSFLCGGFLPNDSCCSNLRLLFSPWEVAPLLPASSWTSLRCSSMLVGQQTETQGPRDRGFNFRFKLLPRGQLFPKLSHGWTLNCVSREDVLGPGWSTQRRAGHIYRDTEKGMATFAISFLGEQMAAAGT